MARFVGTSINRTLGVSAVGGFTKAEVFTTPGTTTWAVPSDAKKLKVFVIGAGSDYTAMTHCYASTNCNSGVASLGCNYCLTFTGHAPGAGGGFAEKLITNPIGTATVTVGQKGATEATAPTDSSFCLPGNSVSITAYSARKIAVNWACTDNSTARDNTYDLPTSIGFQLPICGYINCISGYWQQPGTATGGDINRTGGSSIIIPEFLCDSNIRPDTYQSVSPNVTCGLACTQGTMFFPGTASQRTNLQTAGAKCVGGTGTAQASGGAGSPVGTAITCGVTVGYSFYYGGQGCWCTCAVATSGGGSATPSGTLSISYDPSFKKFSNTPIGLGASSGLSESNGQRAKPEAFTVTPIFDGGNSANLASGDTATWNICVRDVILSTFGSMCYCGCFNATLPEGWVCQSNASTCLGSNSQYWCARGCNCGGCTGGTTPSMCFPKIGGAGGSWAAQPYYDITYIQTETSLSELTGESLELSVLTNSSGVGLSNFRYGSGAGSSAATYGGGGNRCYPAGNGAVVVLY